MGAQSLGFWAPLARARPELGTRPVGLEVGLRVRARQGLGLGLELGIGDGAQFHGGPKKS